MNKKSLLLVSAIVGLMSPMADATTVKLNTPSDCSILGISPNGEWAIGMQGDAATEYYAFRWNLLTNEFDVSPVPAECGSSIANDGTYCGGSPYTAPDGRSFIAPSYFDGEWHILPIPEGNVTDALDGSISSDGRHMAITVEIDGKLAIAQYCDKQLVHVYKGDDGDHSRVSSITDDGRLVGGWTYAHIPGLTINRTAAYWGDNGDKYTLIDPNPQVPHRSPWASVSKFTTDGKKALFYGGWYDNDEGIYILGIKDLETGEYHKIYPVDGSDMASFSITDITDDLHAVGSYDGLASITDPDGKTTYLVDWLKKEKGIDVRSEWPEVLEYSGMLMLNVATCITPDGKAIGMTYTGSDQELHSMIVRFDVEFNNPAPASVTTSEITKAGTVKVSWKMPFGMDMSEVAGYNLYRDGEKINTELLSGDYYFDSSIQPATTYRYEMTAVYGDTESELSQATYITTASEAPEAPTALFSRQKGFNSVALMWDVPATNLIQKHYFDPESENEAFGVSEIDTEAEVGIRFDADELALYKNAKITGVEFYPMSKQSGWRVTFYTQDNDESLESLTRLKSYRISQELNIGKRNVFTLPEALEIPQGKKLILGLSFIGSEEGNLLNIMGMQNGNCIPGYSDLLRQVLIPAENFESFADMASQQGLVLNVAWKLGLIMTPDGTAQDIDAVKEYIVSVDGVEAGRTEDLKFNDSARAFGEHKYNVQAVYENGNVSDAATIVQNVALKDNDAYRAHNINVALVDDMLTYNWSAPEDFDTTDITWAVGQKSSSAITASRNNYNLQALAIYPDSKFRGLEGYTITAVRFYPTADAVYTIFIDNGKGTTYLAEQEVDSYTMNQWNTVTLDKPITVEAGKTYRLVLDCYDVEENGSPLAVDSSNGHDGYSCLINVTKEEENWQEVSAVTGKSCNWMMGLVAESPEELPIEVKGYDVLVDGNKLNSSLLTETTYSHQAADLGNDASAKHQLTVNTWYEVYPEALADNEKTIFTLAMAGLNENSVASLKLSRTGNILTVAGAESVEIYNLSGVKVLTANGCDVNIDALGDGIYVLKAEGNGSQLVTKLNITR